MKAVNTPGVRVPARTSCEPHQRTATIAKARHHFHCRTGYGLDASDAHVDAEEAAEFLVEARAFVILHAEGFDHAIALVGLLQKHIEPAELALCVFGHLAHALGKAHHGEDGGREDDQGDERELPIDVKGAGQYGEQACALAEDGKEAVDTVGSNDGDVVDDARHHHAGGRAVEKREGLVLQGLVQLAADIESGFLDDV